MYANPKTKRNCRQTSENIVTLPPHRTRNPQTQQRELNVSIRQGGNQSAVKSTHVPILIRFLIRNKAKNKEIRISSVKYRSSLQESDMCHPLLRHLLRSCALLVRCVSSSLAFRRLINAENRLRPQLSHDNPCIVSVHTGAVTRFTVQLDQGELSQKNERFLLAIRWG